MLIQNLVRGTHNGATSQSIIVTLDPRVAAASAILEPASSGLADGLLDALLRGDSSFPSTSAQCHSHRVCRGVVAWSICWRVARETSRTQ
eukprot:3234202-Prymnesium_polylepis.1